MTELTPEENELLNWFSMAFLGMKQDTEIAKPGTYNTLVEMMPKVNQLLKDSRLLAQSRAEVERLRVPRVLDAWHEDYGPKLWWKFPVEEAPYSGSPLDDDWPGYHTHFTDIPMPIDPPSKENE